MQGRVKSQECRAIYYLNESLTSNQAYDVEQMLHCVTFHQLEKIGE